MWRDRDVEVNACGNREMWRYEENDAVEVMAVWMITEL